MIKSLKSYVLSAFLFSATLSGSAFAQFDPVDNDTYVAFTVGMNFAPDAELRIAASNIQLSDITGTSDLSGATFTGGLEQHSNGNSNKYSYSSGYIFSGMMGFRMSENCRVAIEAFSLKSPAKDNDNNKTYESLSINNLEADTSAAVSVNVDFNGGTGTGEAPRPTVSNEDGVRTYGGMFNAQIGGAMSEEFSLYAGAGVGYVWSKAYDTNKKSLAWQATLTAEFATSDTMSIIANGRYFRPMSDDYKDVSFTATSRVSSASGTVTVPAKISSPYSTWSIELGTKIKM